jgi:hypothetical protein
MARSAAITGIFSGTKSADGAVNQLAIYSI